MLEALRRLLKHFKVSVYYPALRLVVGYILVFFIGYILNIAGLKELNFLILLVFILASTIYLVHPTSILTFLGLSSILGVSNRESSFAAEAVHLKNIVVGVLLWGSFIFFLLATKSFEQDPLLFFAVLSCVVILFLVFSLSGIGSIFRVKFVYIYVTAVLAYLSLSLIPGPLWVTVVGFDPMRKFGLTPLSTAIYDVTGAQQEVLVRLNTARLNEIQEKIESGIALTNEDQIFMTQMDGMSRARPGQQERLSISCNEIANEEVPFFIGEMTDRRPNRWYYENSSGEIEWYAQAGYNDFSNELLLPVDNAFINRLVIRCQQQLEGEASLEIERLRQEEEAQLRAEEQEIERNLQIAEQQRISEAERLQRLDEQRLAEENRSLEFAGLVESYSSASWLPRDIWVESLRDRNVELFYSDLRREQAAQIVSRLNELGAAVKIHHIENDSVNIAPEVIYPSYLFDQATDLQASIVDILRMSIVSDANQVALVIRL